MYWQKHPPTSLYQVDNEVRSLNMTTTGGKEKCNRRERERKARGEKREQVPLCLYFSGAAALEASICTVGFLSALCPLMPPAQLLSQEALIN